MATSNPTPPAGNAPGPELSDAKRRLLEMMLAERKAQRQREADAAEAFPQADREQPLALSYQQERLWFLSELEKGSPAYNIPAGVYLEGRLAPRLLTEAWWRVLERHEGVRTTFHKSEQGEAFGEILPVTRLPLPVIDLSSLTLQQAEEQAQLLVPRMALRPFDLEHQPALAMSLLRLAPEAHLLLLVIHHIVSDVWSIGVFFRDIGAHYDALALGREPALAPLPLQYADYVVWLRERLEGTGEMDRQLRYWVDQLAGAPPVLELPLDFPRPPVQTFRGQRRPMRFGGNIHRRLAALAKPEEASLYMAALAVFFLQLYRTTGQRDLLVGTPTANRDRVELEQLVGFFVNTLVLRARFSSELTFRQLLRQVRETCLQALAHHDLPFERVVHALKLPRDPSRNPLSQIDFAFQNLPTVELTTPGLTLKPFTLAETTSRFDLEFDLKEGEDGFDGFIRYNLALFAESSIERMARHYGLLLERVVAQPDVPLAQLSMLAEAEEAQLLRLTPGPALPALAAPTIHAAIAAAGRRDPTAVAAVGPNGERWSWAELGAAAGQVAAQLAALGVGPEERIGLAAARSLPVLAGLLGTLEAGGAYVPLDPRYPEARLRLVLEDSGARWVLAERAVAEALPFLADEGRTVLLLEDLLTGLAGVAKPPGPAGAVTLQGPAGGEGAAYVLYTSGSTGRPKGVVVTHGNVLSYLAATREAYGLDGGEGSLVHSSLAFDLTVTSLLAPLAAGRPVRLVADGEGIAPLAAAVAGADDLTLVKLTPAHLDTLAELLPAGALAGRVRAFVVGGEALGWETVAKAQGLAPGARVINEYGPTETTVGCSIEEATAGAGLSVPIGVPIPGARLAVLDPDGNLAPIGVPGELWIAGPGVARGYLGRPGLTAARFVPDPLGPPGARAYRSGDRVRRLADGRLSFLGRTDHQVKVRGFRIELGEVEAALVSHPAIQAAAVLVRQDVPGAPALVAYVAAPKARNLTADEVRAHLASQLPESMVPPWVVFLTALPLTINGKVDRQALPRPTTSNLSRDVDYVAPRTPTETALARIWTEVLKVDRVSVNDRFFDLGGQSMLAVQVVSRVREALQVELSVQALFNETTVASLAGAVEAARSQGLAATLPRVERVPRDQPLPLSFSQERLWFIEQLLPGVTAYNIVGAVRMQGQLDARSLGRALSEIVRRHEILRTTFHEVAGEPRQQAAPARPQRLPLVDLTDLAEADRRPEALALARGAAGRPFDLSRGPLMRAALLRTAADDHLFSLTLHQIVYDMWSRDIFLGELVTLYQSYQVGSSPNLPEPQLQYADFAAWQRRYLDEAALAPQLDYWRRQLADLEPFELPADRARAAVQSFVGTRRIHRLSAELTTRLKKLARRQKVTLFNVILTGFYTLLHRLTQHHDLVVGSPAANRNRVETESLLGFFANTVVLRAAGVTGRTRGLELLERVKTLSLEAFSHQDIPFERLVTELDPRRDMSRAPLFQVMFNYLINYQPPTLRLPGLTLEPEDLHSGGVPFDFMVAMYEAEGRLTVVADYATELYDPPTIDRWLTGFERLLGGLADAPERPLAALPLLSPEEASQLHLDWNATARDLAELGYGGERGLLARFADHVAARPTAPAAVEGANQLSYRLLDRRSSRLAERLRELGVRVESVVALLAPRGLDFLTAMLAVWKAGGAYLPLNPQHPPARSAAVIDASGAELVLIAGEDDAALAAALAERSPARVRVAALADLLARVDAGLSEDDDADRLRFPAPAPEQLAYVIYTSGSTGVPKGVMVHHGGMVNHLASKELDLGFGVGARLAQTAAQTFDISVWQFVLPLVVGGTVHIYGDEVAQEPRALLRAAVADQLTGLELVPSLLAALLDAADEEPGIAAELPLAWLMSTGEALAPGLAIRWLERFPHIPLINAYGPTECSDDVATLHLTQAPAANATAVPIGRPIVNTRLYVVDRQLESVPIGCIGELLVGGEGVGRGYLGAPARTAEAFVPDPFGPAGARLYRSGDRVRWLASGELEFQGRFDFQVKLRGFRIELGEIEAACLRAAEVKEATVLVREDQAGDPRLTAYVVARRAGELDLEALRQQLREQLPPYMVPAALVELSALPLTVHGKVDRKALPAPQAMARVIEPPRTDEERTVAAIFAEILGLREVGAHDDFFDLGGHSLLGLQVVSRLRSAYGIELPLRSLFEASTVAGLAELVKVAQWVMVGAPAGGVAGDELEEGSL